MAKLDNEEKSKKKVLDIVWANIKESYLNVLVKFAIDPATWFNKEYPTTDPNCAVARKVVIGGKLPILEGMYANTLKLANPKAIF